jgi:hypothetical protein
VIPDGGDPNWAPFCHKCRKPAEIVTRERMEDKKGHDVQMFQYTMWCCERQWRHRATYYELKSAGVMHVANMLSKKVR